MMDFVSGMRVIIRDEESIFMADIEEVIPVDRG